MLRIVLVINAAMFLVFVAAALYGRSAALLANSLDNLGDALTYGLSLYVVSRGTAVKGKVCALPVWSDFPGRTAYGNLRQPGHPVR